MGSFDSGEMVALSFPECGRNPRFMGPEAEGDISAATGDRGAASWSRLSIRLSGEEIAAGSFYTRHQAMSACLDGLIGLLRGKTLNEASRITALDIAEAFDDFPDAALPHSVRACSLLDSCLARWRLQSGDFAGPRLLCTCTKVTWETVRESVRRYNLLTPAEVCYACGAGGGCQSCWPDIRKVIAESSSLHEPAPVKDEPGRTERRTSMPAAPMLDRGREAAKGE